ncbi:MAG: hypothetical protein Kow0042_07220 [Calditrichia bacterium]
MSQYPKEVELKDKEKVTLRLLRQNDLEKLVEFFQALPLKDRMFLRTDVLQRENIYRRYGNLNYQNMYPVIAVKNEEIVAIGTLFRPEFGWMRNLGEIRCVVAEKYQRKGLCTILVRELFLRAVSMDLYKLQAELIEDQKSAIAAFQRMGFRPEAVLKKHVTDIQGRRQNLVIMSLDIQDMWNVMEDFISGKSYVV